MNCQQRQISDFLAPPPVSRHPHWLGNSNSTSLSIHELLSRKSNLRYQSNVAEFRIHSGAACSDDQERFLSDPAELLSSECQNSNSHRSFGGKKKTYGVDGHDDEDGEKKIVVKRRQRTLDEFINMIAPTNNGNGNDDDDDDNNHDRQNEDAASPLSGFIGYVSAAEQYRNNHHMSSNNNSNNFDDAESSSAFLKRSKPPSLKTFTKISIARGNGRDPIYFTRQLSSSSSSTLFDGQRQPPLILSVAPSETLLYRLSTSTSTTSPYLSRKTMIANGNQNRRNHRRRNEHLFDYENHHNGNDDDDDNEEDDNKIPNEPILTFDANHVLQQNVFDKNNNRRNNNNHHSYYVRGTFLNHTSAILATHSGKIHCWDLERLLTTSSSSSSSSCVTEFSTSFDGSNNKNSSSLYSSTPSHTSVPPIVSVCTVPGNDDLIFVCSGGTAKLVQIFDLRVSAASGGNNSSSNKLMPPGCVSCWGATGQQINRDPSPLVTFGSTSSSFGNVPLQTRCGGFGSFGTLPGNSTSTTASTTTSSFFGIVGNQQNQGSANNSRNNFSQNNNNNNNSSSSSLSASPSCMAITQSSTGVPCVVVGDSSLMIRCWDLRKVGVQSSGVPTNSTSNNNNSTKPLYETNFREIALAAIDHALPFASSPPSSQMNANNIGTNGFSTFSSQPQQNVLGSIASMKSDPSHPFSVWINTTGGFFGRVEFSGSKSLIPHAFYSEDSFRSALQSGLPPLQMDVLSSSSGKSAGGGDSVIAACPRLFTSNVLVVATTDNNNNNNQQHSTGSQQQQQLRKQSHVYFPRQMDRRRADTFFFNNNNNNNRHDDYDEQLSFPVACTFACGNTSEEMLVVEDQFRQLWVKDVVF